MSGQESRIQLLINHHSLSSLIIIYDASSSNETLYFLLVGIFTSQKQWGKKRMYTHTQKREEQCKFKHQDINIELNL